jgi:arginyl-tRNA synthetase
VKDALQAALWEILGDQLPEARVPAAAGGRALLAGPDAIQLVPPRDPAHGDLATPLAMTLAKALGRPPRPLAEGLAAAVNARGMGVTAEVAGPGFINFRIATGRVQDILARILEAGQDYGRSTSGAGRRINVEYVSANPTGPAVVVSARAAAFGSSLARLLAFSGYQVSCEFYVNDAGAQVAALGASLRARWRELQGEPLAIPENGYHGLYLKDMAAELDPALARAWNALGEIESIERFAAHAVAVMTARMRAEMERFRSPFDVWFSERSLHAAGKLDETLRLFEAKGLVYESEGARWFRSTQFGDDKDRVLVKSSGEATYFLADAAYHLDKLRRGFDKAIDVLGPDHHGHVARMQAIARAIGAPEGWLEILLLQWVTLVEGGQAVAMSKRAGTIATMAELLDDVGVDAARAFFLTRRRDSHLEFDLALAREQSAKSRAFYAQYATARIAGVLRKAAADGLALWPLIRLPLGRLEADAELALIKQLEQFPGAALSAAEAREPNRVFSYLVEVAALFHRFYHEHQIVGEDAELTQARLALCRATRQVLSNGLELMGVQAPEQM